MTTLVKFTAEHIGRTRGAALVRDLEAKDFCVSAARMDPVFENQLIVIVNCDKGEDVKVRDAIWAVNGGACCDMDIITADDPEEYL